MLPSQIKISSHTLTDVNLESGRTFQSTDSYPEFMVLFKSSIGQAGEWNFERTAFPIYTQFIFVCFSILVTIVAMNLLIAMINFTFNRIYKEAEREWWLQRAELILGYESNFSSHWHKFLVNSAAYVRNQVV